MTDRDKLDRQLCNISEEINAPSRQFDALVTHFKELVETRNSWHEDRAVKVDSALMAPCVTGTKKPLDLYLATRKIGEPFFLAERAAAPAKMPAIAGFDPERVDREGLLRMRGHLRLLQNEASRPGALNRDMLLEQARHTEAQIAQVEARLSPEEIEESKNLQLNKTSYVRLASPRAVDSMGNFLPVV